MIENEQIMNFKNPSVFQWPLCAKPTLTFNMEPHLQP